MKNATCIYAPYQGTYLNEEFVGYERAKKYIKEWDVWEKCFPAHVLLWLVNEKNQDERCLWHQVYSRVFWR